MPQDFIQRNLPHSLGLTDRQRREEESLRDVPDPYDNNDTGSQDYETEILHGRARVEISHAGEEAMADDSDHSMLESLREHHKCVSCPFRYIRS